MKKFLKENSLSVVLLALFLLFWGLQSWTEFTGDAEFWFQSMQNWQSEFLAVLAIVVLSIWLRHHASPESKCVWASHGHTGKA